MVLQKVNERAVAKSYLVNTTSRVVYVNQPTYNPKVLLRSSKVLIRNGDHSLEAYAILDDGSECTIILHAVAQLLSLKGPPVDVALYTVRQDFQVLHGVAVSFTVS